MIPVKAPEWSLILNPWSPMARGVLARPWNSRSAGRAGIDGRGAEEARGPKPRDRGRPGDRQPLREDMAQVVFAWSVSHLNENPILGLSSKKRIDEVAIRFQVKLTDGQIRYLEELYISKLMNALER
ncbi:NADP-dependent oxidoreductase domain-containing protein [Aspergillus affinis]|uniref:NADP-dependent oxidoreductase domain-containing protein n=1 Tax=Aspergillus affinis TaxID=1070780 RepID=UPI0022FE4ACE|nr:NADP-dependent oxidoreductase domain-containing protein [Aspergillus affinis]KAI9040971.1 NADP-dependent oxidoreductase domain-containing protein [Aspergillus affinis]